MTPEFKTSVEELFQTEFPTAYDVPIVFSNAPIPDSVPSYVALHIMASDDTDPINIGIKSKSRNVGVIQVDVYTPKDTGSGLAIRMAYAAGKVFKRKNVIVGAEGLIVYKDPSIQDRGEVRGRHKHMMRVPYRYDFKDT